MEALEQIKSIDLVLHATGVLGQPTGVKSGITWFRDPTTKDDTPSLAIYNDSSRGWSSYSSAATYSGWTIIDFAIAFEWCTTVWDAIKHLAECYNIDLGDWFVKEFKKQPKEAEFVENFKEYVLWISNGAFRGWLSSRGVSYDEALKYSANLKPVVKTLWFYEKRFIEKDVYKDILIFPCFDWKDKNVVWCKLRRCDWNWVKLKWSSDYVKSKTVWKSWFIFDEINQEQMILCEGEVDWLILKMLWFKGVIWNLGWVSFKRNLKTILKDVKTIISFYDHDSAGLKANKDLSEYLNRPVKAVKYPNLEWIEKYDVNDLFKMWYKEADFQAMIDEAILEKKEEKEEEKTPENIEELKKVKKKQPVKEKEDGYYFTTVVGETTKTAQITNFKIKVEDIIVYQEKMEEKRALWLKLYNETEEIYWEFKSFEFTDPKRFYAKVWSLKPNFSCFAMSNEQLQALIRFIDSSTAKETFKMEQRWYIARLNIFIFENWVFKDGKFTPFENIQDKRIADLGEYKIQLVKNIAMSPTFQEDLLYKPQIKHKIKNHFRYMFTGLQGDLVIWYLMAAMFVPILKKELTPFPILFVTWKKGYWKTTWLIKALSLYGMDTNPDSFETSTPLVDQKDVYELHGFTTWKDEYKNNKKCKYKDGYLKSVYDRSWVRKWTQSLEIKSFPVHTSLILSGEQFPTDDAVFSRILPININWNRTWKDMFPEIDKTSDFYGSVLREMLENYDFKSLADEYKKILKMVKEISSIYFSVTKRLLNVFAPAIAGYVFFNNFILEWEEMNEESESFANWMEKIMPLIEDKKRRENEEDIINSFFEHIFNLYQNPNSNLWAFWKEIVELEDKIFVKYSYLYDQSKWWDKYWTVTKVSLRDNMKTEYWVETQIKYADARWIKFNKNNLPEALGDIIAYIKKEKAEDENLSF